MFGVEDRDGQLVPDVRFGDALFTFVQAILRISGVSYLSREQVRSTFREDLRAFLADSVAKDRLTLLQYEKWGLPFRSLVIFEDQQQIGRNVLARLTDVSDRQDSSLSGNKDRIRRFLAGGHAANEPAPTTAPPREAPDAPCHESTARTASPRLEAAPTTSLTACHNTSGLR